MRNWEQLKAAQPVVYCLITFLAAVVILSAPAKTQDWPDILDPTQLKTLNMEMDSLDWDTIQNDLTFDIEKQAWF